MSQRSGTIRSDVARRAVERALRAPSVANTQPWRWRIGEGMVQLHADWDRQLPSVDPDRRDLVISCGAALHHLRVALAAAGWGASTQRMPDRENAAHLATVYPGRQPADGQDAELAGAIDRRRTDRRRLSARPVPPDTLQALTRQAARLGAGLHPVLAEPVRARLLAALAQAALRQQRTPGYPSTLTMWSHRYWDAHDGIPLESLPMGIADQDSPGLRPAPPGRLAANPCHLEAAAEAATFAVLTTETDGAVDWLCAGEATSAVLLAATRAGLATTPLSQAIEVEYTRRQLAEEVLGILDHPQLVIRIGWVPQGAGELPATPRRSLKFTMLPD